MAIPTRELTLTPTRFGGEFAAGSSATITPDRDITHLGVRVTPVLLADLDINTVAEVMPNKYADDGEDFCYRVRIHSSDGKRIEAQYVIMPDRDTALFTLVPEKSDPNACTTTPEFNNNPNYIPPPAPLEVQTLRATIVGANLSLNSGHDGSGFTSGEILRVDFTNGYQLPAAAGIALNDADRNAGFNHHQRALFQGDVHTSINHPGQVWHEDVEYFVQRGRPFAYIQYWRNAAGDLQDWVLVSDFMAADETRDFIARDPLEAGAWVLSGRAKGDYTVFGSPTADINQTHIFNLIHGSPLYANLRLLMPFDMTDKEPIVEAIQPNGTYFYYRLIFGDSARRATAVGDIVQGDRFRKDRIATAQRPGLLYYVGPYNPDTINTAPGYMVPSPEDVLSFY